MTKTNLHWPSIKMLAVVVMTLTLLGCSSPEQKSAAHAKSGDQLYQAGEITKASLEYRNAIKYNDKNAEAWLGLANVEEKRQNWPVVAQSLQRVVELDPKGVDALVRLAKLKFAAIRLDEALKDVNSANALKPKDTNILALRAAILFRIGDDSGAKTDAEAALALNPDNPDAHAVLAAERMKAGDAKGAMMFIERGLAKDSKNIGLLLFKLKVFESTQDFAKIEEVLRLLATSYPEQKPFKQAIVSFLMGRNREADAVAEVRGMVDQDPSDTKLALDLVRMIGRSGGVTAARSELDKLVAARPDKVDFKLALAQLDFSESKSDQALKRLDEIISKGDPKGDVLRAQVLLAEIKKQQGKNDEAKGILKSVLDADAKNADALAIRASLSLADGDYEKAVADLREALSQQPDSAQVLMMLAKAHELQGAIDLAVDRFAEAAKASNYAPQVTLSFADLLMRRDRADRVEPLLEEAIKRNPADKQLLAAMAKIKLSKQDWDGAQKIAEAIRKVDSGSGLDLKILGAAQIGANKTGESIDTLKSAYDLAPDVSENMYSLVYAYLKAGKTAEAEQFIKSALDANPKSADALALRGSLQTSQKQLAEAEASFRKAIEAQPDNSVGYIGLGNFYLAQKDAEKAEAVLSDAVTKIKGNLNISLTLAGLKERKGQYEDAIALYEEQLRHTPDAFIIVNNLASLLADNRTDKESLERAYTLSRRLESVDVPQFLDTLGWIAYRKGDYRTALLKLEKAAEKLPNMGVVQYHLGMAYAALKRGADAKARFDKANALLADGDPMKLAIQKALAELSSAN